MADLLSQAVMVLVPMILSLTVHEYAHAWAAQKLGDDTAERMGRLNLNPISHIDPMGTIILPLVLLVAGGAVGGGVPFFGWAKPVPVNGGRFRRTVSVRTGMMFVAAAGPLSNLLMALLCGAVYSLSYHGWLPWAWPPAAASFLLFALQINVALFVFNMIPIYPLDGQKVVSGLLSGEQAIRFERFNLQFGTMLLIFVIVFAREVIAYPIHFVASGVLTVVGLG